MSIGTVGRAEGVIESQNDIALLTDKLKKVTEEQKRIPSRIDK